MSDRTEEGTEGRLRRQLGLLDRTAVAVGAMIGAGVFVSMGEAAKTTGGSLLLAVLIGAAVATFNGLSSAELGAAAAARHLPNGPWRARPCGGHRIAREE